MDRAYPRWPPHINFIFPFVPEDQFDAVFRSLTDADFEPQSLKFDSIGYFSQGKNATFHLKPDARSTKILENVFAEIRKVLPDIPLKHAQFTPHVTLAQTPKKDLHATLSMLESWLGTGISVVFNEISILKRSPETGDKMTQRFVYNTK